jgi:hypothetical protein
LGIVHRLPRQDLRWRGFRLLPVCHRGGTNIGGRSTSSILFLIPIESDFLSINREYVRYP